VRTASSQHGYEHQSKSNVHGCKKSGRYAQLLMAACHDAKDRNQEKQRSVDEEHRRCATATSESGEEHERNNACRNSELQPILDSEPI
jgi:hypothetical protein